MGRARDAGPSGLNRLVSTTSPDESPAYEPVLPAPDGASTHR